MEGKMTLVEALGTGLQTTVIGLSIVFSVLIILMLVLITMKYIFASKTKKETKNETVNTIIPREGKEEKTEDEEELIAILTAAVAASLNTSTYNLKIKSYRRIGNNAPSWNRAGLNDILDSRY